MTVKANVSNIKEVGWKQYAIRFFLGGVITAVAGLIAKQMGPAVGGLFLAFPAIFPASVTLVETTERSKKNEKGLKGEGRAHAAAELDTYGATLGSLALMLFAVFTWLAISRYSGWIVLPVATALWIISAVAIWAGLRWWRHHGSIR